MKKIIYSYHDYNKEGERSWGKGFGKKGVVNEIEHEGGHSRVMILEKPDWGDHKAKKVYEINWSALGSVSVEEAEDYIALLQEAVKVAKAQNA